MRDRHTPIPELTRAATTGDPLSQFHRDIVGRTVRLDVPLSDAPGLRTASAILRELANRFEVLSHDRGETWRVLHAARFEGGIAKRRLQSIRTGDNKKRAAAMGY